MPPWSICVSFCCRALIWPVLVEVFEALPQDPNKVSRKPNVWAKSSAVRWLCGLMLLVVELRQDLRRHGVSDEASSFIHRIMKLKA